MHRPFFSIVIATYNSERTLEYTLNSIENQIFDKNEIEVLIVDGGSTDCTLDIANRFNVRILNNPKKLPEYAKAVGTKEAKGHYVIRMDSDEEFCYSTQLKDKMDFFIHHPEIKMLIPNRYAYGRKEICGVSAEYMNILGDPLSYFIYKTKYDKYNTYKKYIVKEIGREVIMEFNKDDIYPLVDSGTSVFSLDYVKEKYPDTYGSIEFTCGVFDIIMVDTGKCGCIKGDNIFHNCSSSFSTFLSKLKFRVINNLFHKKESGFSNREAVNGSIKKRKALFCIYALLFPLPIIDSIRMAILYKNITYLLHFVYLYYVCIQIVCLGLVKFMGGERRNRNYGK